MYPSSITIIRAGLGGGFGGGEGGSPLDMIFGGLILTFEILRDLWFGAWNLEDVLGVFIR